MSELQDLRAADYAHNLRMAQYIRPRLDQVKAALGRDGAQALGKELDAIIKDLPEGTTREQVNNVMVILSALDQYVTSEAERLDALIEKLTALQAG